MKAVRSIAIILILALLTGVFAACSESDSPKSGKAPTSKRVKTTLSAGETETRDVPDDTGSHDGPGETKTADTQVFSLPEEAIRLCGAVTSDPSAQSGTYAFEDYAGMSITYNGESIKKGTLNWYFLNGTLVFTGDCYVFNWDNIVRNVITQVETLIACDGIVGISAKVSDLKADKLTRVYLADSVVSVGANAFSKCGALESVYFKGVERIGDSAFLECNGLKEITLPETLSYIGRAAFESCRSLTGIVLPSSLQMLCDQAFRYCSGMETLTISESMLGEIKGNTFEDCTSLKELEIPGNVNLISFRAFNGCTSLEKVIFREGVGCISEGAFQGCKKLTEVVLPESIKTLGPEAFGWCTRLESVTIPGGVTEVKGFRACSALTDVRISDGVKAVADYAFSGCEKLKTITLPDSVETVGKGAFGSCKALEKISWKGVTYTKSTKSSFNSCAGVAAW